MSDAVEETQAPVAPATGMAQPGLRRRLFGVVAVVALIGLIGFALWYVLVALREETTDDAYVGGEVAQITPLVSAAVREVRVSDTQAVKAGDVLVVLDDADTRVALAQAEAELQRAIRRVKGYFSTDTSLAAQIVARAADVTRAEAQVTQTRAALEKARSDLAHRSALIASAAVAGEEVSAARNALVAASTNYDTARASLGQAIANRQAAEASLAASSTLTAGSSVPDNPEVASARAKRDQAALDLARTRLQAPFDGVVARRQVQIGQRVASGSALMTIVPVTRLYVDANFKEGQLRAIRAGQPVKLVSDTYGSGVSYSGKVIGRGAGTGSAFALIPTQNATGNWIKVVQRIPVRISLDPRELQAHPLALGASMTAVVDIAN